MSFKFENGNIYSTASGDLVAVVTEEGLKIQPGKNAMTPRIKEFYENIKDNPAAPAETAQENAVCEEEQEEVNTHFLQEEVVREKQAPVEEKKKDGTTVESIPESELPEFDFALGVETPAFKAFVRKHKLNKEQAAALVKRLEKRR